MPYEIKPTYEPKRYGKYSIFAWILTLLIALQICLLTVLLVQRSDIRKDAVKTDQTCWPNNGRTGKTPRPLHKLPCDHTPINISERA